MSPVREVLARYEAMIIGHSSQERSEVLLFYWLKKLSDAFNPMLWNGQPAIPDNVTQVFKVSFAIVTLTWLYS